MTAVGYDPVYLVTLLVIGLGALTFSVLTLHYWRQPSARRDPVFAAFTLACAASFLINIVSRMAPDGWERPLVAALDLATGAIPALLFHLVSQSRGRPVRLASYAVSGAIAIALMLDDLSVWTAPLRDQAPAILLAAAGALGLVFLDRRDRRLRVWYAALLALTVAAAAAGLISPSPIAILAPDFLLLAFLCVTLYYRERLIFFDLLIKRGIFLGIALCALALLLSAGRVPGRLTVLFLCAPLLLLAPWLDGMLSRAVDRLFLGRRYSPAEAERLVLCEVQAAVTEDDLHARAERSFSDIFACAAEVEFAWPLAPRSGKAAYAVLPGAGEVVLHPRASGIPFMTDDRRLLASLAATLAIALENVRFRERHERQQEREQQLRLLASRAGQFERCCRGASAARRIWRCAAQDRTFIGSDAPAVPRIAGVLRTRLMIASPRRIPNRGISPMKRCILLHGQRPSREYGCPPGRARQSRQGASSSRLIAHLETFFFSTQARCDAFNCMSVFWSRVDLRV